MAGTIRVSYFVGNYSWLGLNSILKGNNTIGDHVIVDVGAMLISNVPDDDIVTRVPAKSIKHEVKTNVKFLMAGREMRNLIIRSWNNTKQSSRIRYQ
jgi:serine acetyltransferase